VAALQGPTQEKREQMKRYLKHEADALGPGIAYLEFDGEIPTRQVEKYGDLWLCSIRDYYPGTGPGLTDRALSELGPEPKLEISQEEFEETWNEAVKHV
jgi:hypothetical protein